MHLSHEKSFTLLHASDEHGSGNGGGNADTEAAGGPEAPEDPRPAREDEDLPAQYEDLSSPLRGGEEENAVVTRAPRRRLRRKMVAEDEGEQVERVCPAASSMEVDEGVGAAPRCSVVGYEDDDMEDANTIPPPVNTPVVVSEQVALGGGTPTGSERGRNFGWERADKQIVLVQTGTEMG